MLLWLKNNLLLRSMALLVLFSSCNWLLKKSPEKQPLARAGDAFLYQEDIASLIQNYQSPEDSVLFVTNYINTWAVKQLLLSKAKINLPEEKIQTFDRLIREYRADLYTRAYIEALVQQAQDTAVSLAQLRDYYKKEKDNFKLHEKLVQLRFVALPPQFLHREDVKEKIKNWKEPDKAFLDSIAVQFKKIHFNDSIWVSASQVVEAIPPITPRNEAHYLQEAQFFEVQDSTAVYLGKVTRVLNLHDIAPFDYIAPDLKQLIMNRRRLDYMKKLKTDVINEAIQNHTFEIYETEDTSPTRPSHRDSHR